MKRIKSLPIRFPQYEKEVWLLENGATEAVLVDESETTWENYCAAIVAEGQK
jgi:hypothetical protein